MQVQSLGYANGIMKKNHGSVKTMKQYDDMPMKERKKTQRHRGKGGNRGKITTGEQKETSWKQKETSWKQKEAS